jgi:hypothetical protein
VIAVIGEFEEPHAECFADELPAAVVLRRDDLRAPGWCLDHASGVVRLVLGGRTYEARDLSAVVCAKPQILASDVPWICPGDRAYVATEFTSFLLALLSQLSRLGCPVLNPPVGGCLCGPSWMPESWVSLAMSLGVPVWPLRRVAGGRGTSNSPAGPPENASPVTVVGERVVERDPEPAAADLVDHTVRLARGAGVPVLTATFAPCQGRQVLTGANPWPDLSLPELAAAVTSFLAAAA